MKKVEEKQQNNFEIKEEELANSGVAKLLIQENDNLREEISTLKKSLKKTQDAFEKLRVRFHDIEKDNLVLKQKDEGSLLIKIIKSCALFGFGIGTGILSLPNYKEIAIGLIIISILIYIVAMIIKTK